MTDFDELNAAGLATRGDLFGDQPTPQPRATPIQPPALAGSPAFPEPGIYFGMPEEEYHAIPALSSSGLKKLAVSSMDYWANSNLNPDREEVERKHLDLGKAIHAFVLEGEKAYLDRFAVDLDLADYAEQPILVSTDQIKAAIGKFFETVPVKPVGRSKQDFIDQLFDLGAKHDITVNPEGDVPTLKARIGEFKEPQPVKPVTRVPDTLDDGTEFQRPATKDDLANQLLALDPNAMVWDKLFAANRRIHEGKTFIDARTDRRIRIAVRMIMGHEEIAKAFSGGYPEVSIFWYCRETGVPMKARLDYLKLRAIVDLKSFGNNAGKPIDRAIESTIASYKYNMQQVVYDEAAAEAKALIQEKGIDAIHVCGDLPPPLLEPYRQWCLSWAKQDTPGFIFVFQQTGNAPVTRGKIMPRGTVFSVTRSRVASLKAKWAECAKTYGADPWLDIAPMDEIEDEAIPLYATEI